MALTIWFTRSIRRNTKKNSSVLSMMGSELCFLGISDGQTTRKPVAATTTTTSSTATTPCPRRCHGRGSRPTGAASLLCAGGGGGGEGICCTSRCTAANPGLIRSRRHQFATGFGTTFTSLVPRRFESTEAQLCIDSESGREDDDEDDHDQELDRDNSNDQGLDFPGGKVMFASEMSFLNEDTKNRVPCFRVLDDIGNPVSDTYFYEQVSEEMARKMYRDMVTLQIMDTFLYEAQRQGRISFYMTCYGEEAINIASAAALSVDDVVFAQYREPGVLLWRGFTMEEFANQCFGNKADYGKGRQMPVHYGSKEHNYFTISSPIATQLPQAAGAAYSLKMDHKDACVVAYLGDGSTSEGDFHAGLNFAAVMEVPIVFICRNNGWAISTPIADQFRSDGVVVKGQAYGITSIRVDGNDALAVYNVIKAAREMAIRDQRPILVEALTYRVSHHSTSDDSTKYRPVDEIQQWKTTRNPLTRFRNWVAGNGWWSDVDESQLRSRIKNEMIQAIRKAERLEKPGIAELFTDVYDVPTPNLYEQERMLKQSIATHPNEYPRDVPV